MIGAIRIAIVDDHPLFREGVTRSLSEIGGFEMVGEGATARTPNASSQTIASRYPAARYLHAGRRAHGLGANILCQPSRPEDRHADRLRSQ